LVMFEEFGERLELAERVQTAEKLKKLLAATQQLALSNRVEKCITAVDVQHPDKSSS